MTMETLLSQYMPSENAVKNVGEFFAVFSHETRIRILIMLSVSELNVNDISRALQLNQSTISHQLRILKEKSSLLLEKAKKNIMRLRTIILTKFYFPQSKRQPKTKNLCRKRLPNNNFLTNYRSISVNRCFSA